MKVLLNAGFGDPLGGKLLDTIQGLGFAGIRQDVKTFRPALVSELCGRRMTVIYVIDINQPDLARVVADHAVQCDVDFILEIGNELDRCDPRWYSDFMRQFDGLPHVITAGISSVSKRSLKWVSDVLRYGIPDDMGIGYHTYRSGSPVIPGKGFLMRFEELYALEQAAQGRKLYNTEVGWSNARTSWWPWVKPLSEKTVAEYLKTEISYNTLVHPETLVIYQLNDSNPPTRRSVDNMGIRRYDGSWKPSAYILLREE